MGRLSDDGDGADRRALAGTPDEQRYEGGSKGEPRDGPELCVCRRPDEPRRGDGERDECSHFETRHAQPQG